MQGVPDIGDTLFKLSRKEFFIKAPPGVGFLLS